MRDIVGCIWSRFGLKDQTYKVTMRSRYKKKPGICWLPLGTVTSEVLVVASEKVSRQLEESDPRRRTKIIMLGQEIIRCQSRFPAILVDFDCHKMATRITSKA